jgi:hypothetical protein
MFSPSGAESEGKLRDADAVSAGNVVPRTAALLEDLGFTPVIVDISEFEKLEGCVTCLSVLLPGRVGSAAHPGPGIRLPPVHDCAG